MILSLEKAIVWSFNLVLLVLLSSLSAKNQDTTYSLVEPTTDLKTKTFKILDNKCNVCHKKRNPFMVFKPKNMERRAKKIHHQVVVTKRMPKGNEYPLTKEEYATLLKWLDKTLQTE
jgi:uncharacterized membrane protein